MANFPSTIHEYIQAEENSFQTEDVKIFDNFDWSMLSHIQTSLSFKFGKFLNATNDLKTKNPFRNVVLPNLRLRYRAEDLDVKDVILYVEDENKYHLSFLIKKYYEDVFLVENDLDSFFDYAKEQKVDFGGCLVKKTSTAVPEVVPLESIAFCDQTDLLGGPIAVKINLSPDQLRTKAKQGWGDPANGATVDIETLITLAKNEKDPNTQFDTETNKTTGKNIEIYIVRGQMPASYLSEDGDMDEMVNQIQVVAFYINERGEKDNVILYRKKEVEDVYKSFVQDKVHNRALGFGGVEELFDAQIWTNFAEISKKNLLEAASKVPLFTDDDSYHNRNRVRDMENLEITVVDKESRYGIQQVPTGSANISLFNESLNEWGAYAQEMAGATDPLLGKQPPAGTPFRLQERVVFEAKGLHDYRRGQFAKFVEAIYKDWIIPHIKKQITKGAKFLSTLTLEELQFVAERTVVNQVNKMVIDSILDGKIMTREEIELRKAEMMQEFLKGGNKRFIEILKDEFKDAPITVKVSVDSKQKDLGFMADQLSKVLSQYLATPQMTQDPYARQILNRLLEASGMSPIDFESIPALPQQAASASSTAPIRDLPQNNEVVTS